MNSKPTLKIDWCTHEAARFAVEKWHYSNKMPAGKLAKFGVWEGGSFIGAVLFGTGACPQINGPFDIQRIEACELVRVALTRHAVEVSRVISICLRILKKEFPTLRIVVSYADPEQEHHGGIYQAGNWLYLGTTAPVEWFIDNRTGRRVHTKTLRTGRRGLATRLKESGQISTIHLVKHKYVYPLDAAMRKQLEPLRQPYPKRARSVESDTPGNPVGNGRCNSDPRALSELIEGPKNG
jgi:hypothetical protein